MPRKPQELLEQNRAWAKQVLAQDSQYFARTAETQTPSNLWIGCSDSRVNPAQILDLAPQERSLSIAILPMSVTVTTLAC